MKIRVGFGFDVHRLEEGLPLIIGGVELKHDRGIVAHSDGDVLIHAICDAVLGAANLGDIGKHFPDTDAEFHKISSLVLLEKTVDLIKSKGFEIGNIDSTLCMEKPKILPFVEEMKKNISTSANINVQDISIKATTNEKIGYIGREEGVSAYAVVLITRI